MEPGGPLSEAELAQLVFTDDLTGLFNRRYLNAFLESKLTPGAPALTLAIFDIDRFKDINDRGGHSEGDRVLREMAAAVRGSFAKPAVTVRWAGDEFAILLPGASKADAVADLEAFRKDVEAHEALRGDNPGPVTISIGIAGFPEDATAPEQLFVQADRALYQAKREGRNRVVAAGRLDLELLAERDAFVGLPCPTFVGRAAESEAADLAFEGALAGKPSFLYVTGPAGSGKTRVLLELVRRAQERGMIFLYMACSELDLGIPFRPFFFLIEQVAARHPQRLAGVLAELDDAALGATVGEVPALAACAPRAVKPPFDDHERRRGLLEGLTAIVRSLAATEGLALIIDHAHLLDSASQRLAAAFLKVAGTRFLVAGAVSFEVAQSIDFANTPASRWLAGLTALEGARTISLTPLAPGDVGAMIAAILPGAAFAAELQALLAGPSQGNPLYVEEAIRSLLIRGIIARTGNRWRLDPFTQADLPAGLDEIIRSMLRCIPGEAGEMLTNAAVIGEKFDTEVLRHVVRKSAGETQDLVDEIERMKLIAPGEGENEYTFLQPRVRRSRYDETDPTLRAEIHKRVGEYEAERKGRDRWRSTAAAAHHMDAAGEADRARTYKEALAELARRIFSLEEAGEAVEDLAHARRLKIPEIREPLNDAGRAQAAAVVRALATGIHQLRLYPPESLVAKLAFQQVRDELGKLLQGAPGVTFGHKHKALIVNGRDTEKSSAADDLAKLLDDLYIQSLTVRHGLHDHELQKLLRKLAEPIKTVPPEGFWDQFLTASAIFHVGVHQRAFVSSEDEGRTVIKIGAELPLAAGTVPSMSLALRSMKAAIDNIRLYPPGSRVFKEGLDEFERGIQLVLKTVPSVTVAAVEGMLLINGQPALVSDYGQTVEGFSKLLLDRLAGSVTIFRGVNRAELSALAEALAPTADDIKAHGGPKYWDRIVASGKLGKTSVGQRVYRVEQSMTAVAEGLEAVLQKDPAAAASAPRNVDPITFAQELLAGPPSGVARLTPARWMELLEALAQSEQPDLGRALAEHVASGMADTDATLRTAVAELLNATLNAAPDAIRTGLLDSWTPALIKHATEEADEETLRVLWSASLACMDASLAQGRSGPALEILLAFRQNRCVTTGLRHTIDRAVSERLEKGRFSKVIDRLMSGDIEHRRGALEMCRYLGQGAVEPLLTLVETETNEDLRQEVMHVLLEVAPDAAARVAARVDPNGDPEVQKRLLTMLPPLGGEAAADAAIRALSHHSAAVRMAALSLTGVLDPGPATRVLDAAMKLGDPKEKAAALAAGGERKLVGMAPRISRLLRATHHPDLAKPLCEFLGKVGGADAVHALIDVVEQPRKWFGLGGGYPDEMRAMAVHALASLTGPETEAAIERALKDRSAAVRGVAKAAAGSRRAR